ncbi:MAG TPA: exodeoxyribonuclease VII small subunit [bacterium]
MAASKSKSMTFEEAFQKLESIVETLEKGECSLDESVRLFEEGMTLSRFCSDKLNEAEKRLARLVKNEQGDFQLEPME